MSDDLQSEAEMLARRSCAERRMYLDEVAACYKRGPEIAEALRRAVDRVMCGQDPPACTGART